MINHVAPFKNMGRSRLLKKNQKRKKGPWARLLICECFEPNCTEIDEVVQEKKNFDLFKTRHSPFYYFVFISRT